MTYNPRLMVPDFFCIFPMNFAMATLGLKEMGKFLWEGKEKSLPYWLHSMATVNLNKSEDFVTNTTAASKCIPK